MFDPNATTDELIALALAHPSDGPDDEATDLHWKAVVALHERGTREVFDAATRLLVSACGAERELGVDIHAQLGHDRQKPFAADSTRLLIELLEVEQNPKVIYSALIGFGHLQRPESVPALIRFATHRDADIRYGVAFGLAGQDDERAVGALIALTNDPEERVRDWATFALASQTDWDSPELRAALWARATDSDSITRGEALQGLASRRAPGVVNAIIKELSGPDPHDCAVEAADILADPRLVPALERLLPRWDAKDWLAGVIEECRNGERG
jgi:HEAT repeat protein